MGVIYLARCKVNGKGYIGFTFDLEERKKRHRVCAEDGATWAFSNAIRKYGWDAFEWTILYQDEDDDREWLGWWERKFIRELKTKAPNGYNMTDGGDGVVIPMTEATKRKISLAKKGKPLSEKNRIGLSIAGRKRRHPPETIEKMRKSHAGFRHTEESREKLRNANLGKKASEATKEKLRLSHLGNAGGMLGKKHSKESREKMSISGKNRAPDSDETRRNKSEATRIVWMKRKMGQ